MHVITKSCILLLWMHTLTFVKSQAIKCELSLPALRGTTYEPANKNRFSPGEKVRVTCGDTYWILDSHTLSAETACKEDGEWTTRPVCREVTCSHPRDRDRYLSYWEDRLGQRKRLGNTVRYRCSAGYRSTGGATRATCTRDGWEPNPLCEDQQCPSIHVPSNVKVTGYREKAFYGNRVRFSCKSSNQTLKGPGEVFCNENGEWSEPVDSISCKDIFCGRPPSLEDGDTKNTTKEHYKSHETIEYMCQKYYTMEGEPYRTCYDGEWTGNMRCLGPCIVNEDEMKQHNIIFKSSDYNKYLVHDEIVEFKCARGLPVGTLSMRQRCNSGVIVLPTCREALS